MRHMPEQESLPEASLKVHSWGDRQCVLNAEGTVDGTSAVKARLTLEQFNLVESNPSLMECDERNTREFRDQFTQLWSLLISLASLCPRLSLFNNLESEFI